MHHPVLVHVAEAVEQVPHDGLDHVLRHQACRGHVGTWEAWGGHAIARPIVPGCEAWALYRKPDAWAFQYGSKPGRQGSLRTLRMEAIQRGKKYGRRTIGACNRQRRCGGALLVLAALWRPP